MGVLLPVPLASVCFLQADRVGSGKCMFFVRINPKGVSEKAIESDIAVGEIQGSALDTFKALVADLYLPVLQEQGSWGKMPADHMQEFLAGDDRAATSAAPMETAAAKLVCKR